MKQKTISAVIALLIIIPFIYIGGTWYKAAVMLVGAVGLIELIKAKSKNKKVPLLVSIIAVLNFLIIMGSNVNAFGFSLILPIKYLILNVASLMLPMVFYHDTKKYNIEDAMFLLGSTLFLSIGFTLLMSIREYNIYYFIFILIITFSTDIFSYITGMLIGRKKFSPSISPNKTVEGFLGGLVFSTIITTYLYIVSFDYTENIIILVLTIIFISLMAILGDLMFSSIKRHFGIKDFGNIMPGHGGVLDRLDGLIFVLMIFYIISNFI